MDAVGCQGLTVSCGEAATHETAKTPWCCVLLRCCGCGIGRNAWWERGVMILEQECAGFVKLSQSRLKTTVKTDFLRLPDMPRHVRARFAGVAGRPRDRRADGWGTSTGWSRGKPKNCALRLPQTLSYSGSLGFACGNHKPGKCLQRDSPRGALVNEARRSCAASSGMAELAERAADGPMVDDKLVVHLPPASTGAPQPDVHGQRRHVVLARSCAWHARCYTNMGVGGGGVLWRTLGRSLRLTIFFRDDIASPWHVSMS